MILILNGLVHKFINRQYLETFIIDSFMRAFTLDLSKEAMLFLQLKLPKGYSLVKTAKETKKGSKIVKNSTISQEEIHRDSTS